jgi:hypothetical protein
MQSPKIEVVAFSNFPAPVGSPEGYGIFIDAGPYRMQVGSILPRSTNEVLLNVEIMQEMHIPGYETGSMSQVCVSVEDATEAARSFLTSKLKP